MLVTSNRKMNHIILPNAFLLYLRGGFPFRFQNEMREQKHTTQHQNQSFSKIFGFAMGKILQHYQIVFLLILQIFQLAILRSSFLLRCFTACIIVCSYICVSLIFFFKLSHFTLLIKSFFQGGVIVLKYTNRYTQMNIYV